MFFLSPSVGLAMLASAPCLVAQQTWIVDSTNRPGAHFIDLPPAEAAASSGDTILLREAVVRYSPIVTSKALRIVADVGSMIDSGRGTFIIRQIPAGQAFVLAGVTFVAQFANATSDLKIENCQGRVHIDKVLSLSLVRVPVPAIEISGCVAVSVSNTMVSGTPGMYVLNSGVALAGCTVTGTTAGSVSTAFPGLVVDGSLLSAADTRITAGWGNIGALPEAGLVMNSAVVAVTRGGRSLIQSSLIGIHPMEAVRGAGLLLIDPAVPVLSHAAARTVGVIEVPTVLAGLSARLSNNLLQTQLSSPAGNLFVLLVGRPSVPSIGSFPEQLWADPSSLQVLAAGVQGATGNFALDLPIPPGILPRGTPLAFHAVSGPITGLKLTPPAIVVAQ